MFESAVLKVKRAHQHILDFNQVSQAFTKTDFYAFSIEEDRGTRFLRLNMVKPAPEELALILGDTIHNLRSALDHAYVDLVKGAGKQPDKWTSFRIWDDRDKLVKTLSKGKLEGQSDIIALLADTVCAYEGGNALLEALDCLDIADKHVVSLPTFSVVRLDHVFFTAQTAEGGSIKFCDVTLGFDDSRAFDLIDSSTLQNLEIQQYGNPTFGIFFGDGTSLKGQPVLPTLTQFTQLVMGIVEQFARTLQARAAG